VDFPVWLPVMMMRELKVFWFIVVARCDLPDGGLVARFHDTGVKVALVYG